MLTNEEVVRAYYAAVDRGVIDNVVDIFALDAEYYRPGYPPMHGREQLRNFYTNQRVLIGGQHIIELVVIDDSGRFETTLLGCRTLWSGGTDFCPA
jgi:ketosteroid isomerase-like protein